MPQFEIRLFAIAREAAGQDRIVIDSVSEPTVSELLDEICQRIPDVAPLLPSCRLAVNGAYADPASIVPFDSDVALIPPVSGG